MAQITKKILILHEDGMTAQGIANALRIPLENVTTIIAKQQGYICGKERKKKKPCTFCPYYPLHCSGKGWAKGDCFLKHNGGAGQ